MERNFVDGYVEWQANPEITGVNRLPQHATFMPYASFEEAQKAERYAYRPSDFAQVHYDTHNWDTVQVPGSWQMQGYDQSQYCNVRYPW